jgi:hypothetical protein
MQNTLTQNFTAYNEQIFINIMDAKTMGPEDYIGLVHMVKEDLALGLVPKQVGNGLLEELSTIMN